MSQLVIGAGQVGTAIQFVLDRGHEAVLRDVHEPDGVQPDALHICFPWSATFIAEVLRYEAAYQPRLTIIHSTVPVGTSRRLGAVHSPVTGRHPYLADGVLAFVKFFGGALAAEAAAIFQLCGVHTRTVPDSETTEAGKLWQTLQYGWLIALQKQGYRWFRQVGADPDVAYREFNRVYTDGYADLGEPFSLPILADMPGPIGGHCVIPNAHLTDEVLAKTLIDLDQSWQTPDS